MWATAGCSRLSNGSGRGPEHYARRIKDLEAENAKLRAANAQLASGMQPGLDS
jgi:hypothetical protein